MKYCATANMSALPSASHGSGDHAEVESLLQSWQGELLLSKLPNHHHHLHHHHHLNNNNNHHHHHHHNHHHSHLNEEPLSPEETSSEDTKSGLDVLDHLIMNSNGGGGGSNLAELKPLPPFTGYTGHLSINGISGHHYHAIAQRLPEENNNNSGSFPSQSGGYGGEQNVVSSSTCGAPDSNAMEDVKPFHDTKLFSPSAAADSADSKLFLSSSAAAAADSASGGHEPVTTKQEMYDISSIEDIAAIIGSAIADTTVPSSQVEDPEQSASRDSWMDLDAWFEGTCGGLGQDTKIIISPDNMSEFVLPHSPQHLPEFSTTGATTTKLEKDYGVRSSAAAAAAAAHGGSSTLQTLLTHTYMPLLQNRLQNGPPVKQEMPSSTSYGMDVISTSSPPGNVVSTTDSLLLNGRYGLAAAAAAAHQHHQHQQQQHHYGGIKSEAMCSPDDHMMGHNYPHTTTNATPSSSSSAKSSSKRSRAQKKQQAAAAAAAAAISHSIAFQSAADLSGLLGKEKPVHRCSICNRGFLNKSNIKVHLRTHTGEKPFRCEVCSKAFRQKAHLIKHQQIHKRIGRD